METVAGSTRAVADASQAYGRLSSGQTTRSAMLIHSCRIDISISNLLGSQAPFKGLS
ncbi:hypothetical protein PAMC26510_14075 [Caballeronia sordidicola]|uniref:Uncharacterized protein n=1 Tax=Caballeronia sordidicola TaxID=196367 RepID=A0A242MW06_CABSO|nr:hypothetical protein PAMC26510_14075 [Caballeronia sordidicola]